MKQNDNVPIQFKKKKKKIVPTFKLNKIDFSTFVFTSANDFLNPSISPETRELRPSLTECQLKQVIISFPGQASLTPSVLKKQLMQKPQLIFCANTGNYRNTIHVIYKQITFNWQSNHR